MRLRSIVFSGLVLLAASAMPAQLKYNVFVKGEKVGTVVSETTGNDTDGYVDETTIVMKQEGKSLTIKDTSKYGKDGVVTSKSTEVDVEDKEAKLKAKLSDDGAKVSVDADGQKQENEIALATKTSRADETNFWFKTIQPEVGKKIVYQNFDMQKGAWVDVTITFVGKKTVKVNDKDVSLNKLTRIDGTDADSAAEMYVDDKGDPVLIIEGEMRIERVQE